MKLKPKYIKKANQWLVHEIKGQNHITNKTEQKMHWFTSEVEAQKFYEEAN